MDVRTKIHNMKKKSTYRTQQDAAFGVTKFLENVRPILKETKEAQQQEEIRNKPEKYERERETHDERI